MGSSRNISLARGSLTETFYVVSVRPDFRLQSKRLGADHLLIHEAAAYRGWSNESSRGYQVCYQVVALRLVVTLGHPTFNPCNKTITVASVDIS